MKNLRIAACITACILFVVEANAQHRRAVCQTPSGCAAPEVAPPATLGNFDVAPDPSRAVVMHAVPEADTSASVTTSDGTSWRLTVPAGALFDDQAITITPLLHVTRRGSSGVAPIAGILLEPNHLMFREPAILSVTSPTGAINVVTSEHDGSSVQRAIPTGSSLSTVYLFHFSTADTIPPASYEEARLAYRAALNDARSFLSKNKGTSDDYDHNIPTVPADPCRDPDAQSRADGDVRTFMDQFEKPESGYANAILSAARTLSLMGDPPDPTEYGEMIADLTARVIERGLKAVSDVRTRKNHGEEYSLALSKLLLGLIRERALFGVSPDSYQPTVFNALVSWLQQILDDNFKAITDDHDLQKIQTVLADARTLAFMTGSEGDVLQRLEKALHFSMKIDMDSSVQGSQTLILKGSGQWELKPDELMRISGNGHVTYSSGTGSNPAAKATLTLTSGGFDASAKFNNADPCKGTMDILLSQLAATPENWQVCQSGTGGQCQTQDFSAHDPFVIGFTDKKGPGGFTFSASLRNFLPDVVSQTFSRTGPAEGGGTGTASMQFTVTHTPQK